MIANKFAKYTGVLLIMLLVFGGCGNDSKVESAESINKTYKKNFSYDSVNRVVKEDLGNGKYIEYVYDDSGNLIKQTIFK